jgi:hypothetical protein
MSVEIHNAKDRAPDQRSQQNGFRGDPLLGGPWGYGLSDRAGGAESVASGGGIRVLRERCHKTTCRSPPHPPTRRGPASPQGVVHAGADPMNVRRGPQGREAGRSQGGYTNRSLRRPPGAQARSPLCDGGPVGSARPVERVQGGWRRDQGAPAPGRDGHNAWEPHLSPVPERWPGGYGDDGGGVGHVDGTMPHPQAYTMALVGVRAPCGHLRLVDHNDGLSTSPHR